jgi:serine/threonine protein kinase
MMPRNIFSNECEDLLRRLLKRNPLERLGASRGAQEIKSHAWFKDVDWDDVYRKRLFPKIYKEKVLKQKQNKINM